MRIIAKSRVNDARSELVLEDGVFELILGNDPAFRDLLDRAFSEGISEYRCIEDNTLGSIARQERVIRVGENGFALCVREYLQSHGYRIEAVDLELDAELRRMFSDNAKNIPQDVVAELSRELPRMSRLDKTFALKLIKQKVSAG